MFAMFVNSDRWKVRVSYIRSMFARCFRVLLSTKESDVYPAAARELKAELLNTLPGNLVNSKCQSSNKYPWASKTVLNLVLLITTTMFTLWPYDMI